MRTKMIGAFVCTLMILATAVSVAGNLEKKGIVNNESVFLNVAPPEAWNKTYGAENYDNGFSVQETSDGGYIFCGTTTPEGETYTDVYLVKTDADGIVEWEKNYGSSDPEYGYSVQQTSDEGFIVVGYTIDLNTDNMQVYLLKTNELGDYSWSTSHGDSGSEEGYSVDELVDGGYIITGYTDSFSTSNDVYLLKTDSIGKFVWQKNFGGSGTNIGFCVKQTSDKGFIIVGSSDSTGSNNELWLIKTDKDGTFEWNRKYGGIYSDRGNYVQVTNDGGYIITGTTSSYGAGGQDVWLIKTDSVGIKDWDETFGGSGSDIGEEVQETSDGGYLVVGHTTSFGAGSEDVYLIKTDGSGTAEWEKTIGGAQNDQGHSAIQDTSDNYIIAGETLSYGTASSFDAWLIKVRYANTPPNKPARPDGPVEAEVGWREYYSSSAIDPDGHDVYLMFDWGDGSFSDWLGPVSSGESIREDHWWTQKGSYQIKVKAMDVLGDESVWSDPLTVTMPKDKAINALFINWLEDHPNLFPLLRYFLGL